MSPRGLHLHRERREGPVETMGSTQHHAEGLQYPGHGTQGSADGWLMAYGCLVDRITKLIEQGNRRILWRMGDVFFLELCELCTRGREHLELALG